MALAQSSVSQFTLVPCNALLPPILGYIFGADPNPLRFSRHLTHGTLVLYPTNVLSGHQLGRSDPVVDPAWPRETLESIQSVNWAGILFIGTSTLHVVDEQFADIA